MRLVEEDPCFVKALPDEPAFVLLARDPMAAALVRTWCAVRRMSIADGSRPASDLDQVVKAENTADAMELWRSNADEAWRKQGQLPLVATDRASLEDAMSVDARAWAAAMEAAGPLDADGLRMWAGSILRSAFSAGLRS